MRHSSPKASYPEKIDVAFSAAAFRDKLDILLKEFNAHILLGWAGKWAKVQVMFPEASTDTVITIMETAKGKHTRYVCYEEDIGPTVDYRKFAEELAEHLDNMCTLPNKENQNSALEALAKFKARYKS